MLYMCSCAARPLTHSLTHPLTHPLTHSTIWTCVFATYWILGRETGAVWRRSRSAAEYFGRREGGRDGGCRRRNYHLTSCNSHCCTFPPASRLFRPPRVFTSTTPPSFHPSLPQRLHLQRAEEWFLSLPLILQASCYRAATAAKLYFLYLMRCFWVFSSRFYVFLLKNTFFQLSSWRAQFNLPVSPPQVDYTQYNHRLNHFTFH